MDDADEPHDPTPGQKPPHRRVGYWGAVLLASFTIVLLVQIVVLTPYGISSDSMVPTLEPGDRVIVNRRSYGGGTVERGEVIVFERPPLLEGEDDVIKRVVGLPGETVRFIGDNVYIDGLLMVEPYVSSAAVTNSPQRIPGCDPVAQGGRQCVVPDGYVFVLGDNRDGSVDSRQYGPVAIDTIVGRAMWRVWPPSGINRL